MTAIVAMARNRVIGAEGKIPWHLPEDLKFFKRLTLGHAVVMGRKTYESIGRPLPGRENWVLTSGSLPDEADGAVRIIRSTMEVPACFPDGREMFVIGGAAIYAALLPQCEKLYLTRLDREVTGDTFFPVNDLETEQGEEVGWGEGYVISLYRRRKV